MKKSENAKKKSIMKYWVFTYLSILCIPLAATIIISGQAFRIIEQEVSSAHLDSLKQMQSFIDRELSAVLDTALKLTTNDQVNIAQGIKWDISSSDHYLFHSVQKDFKILCSTNSFIKGIYVYQEYCDILLSDRDVYYSTDFSFANQENFQIDPKEFEQMLQKKYSGNFLFLDAVDQKGEKHTQILYAISLPLMPTDVVKLNLFVSVDWEQLNHLLHERNWRDKNYVSIMTEDGYQVLAPNGEMFRDYFKNGLFSALKSGDNITIENESYRFSSVSSSIIPATYFSLIPLHEYQKKIDSLIAILILCTAVCVVSGGVLCYVYARQNYRPVQQLLDLLKGRKSERKKTQLFWRSNDSTEFSLIQDDIQRLLDTNHLNSKELDWSLARLRERTVSQMLEGSISNYNKLEDELKKLGISFPSRLFFTVAIYVESFENLFFDGSATNDEDTYHLVVFIIHNVVEELFSEHFTAAVTEIKGDIAFLLSSPESDETQARRQLAVCIESAQKLMREKFGITLSFSAGGPKEGYAQIPESYEEALQVQEYHELTGDTSAVFLDEIESQARPSVSSSGTSGKLINCLLAEDFDTAHSLLHELFQGCPGSELTPRLARNRAYGVITVFLDSLDVLKNREPELFENLTVPGARELYGYSQPSQLEQVLQQVLTDLQKSGDHQNELQQNELKQNMLRYVDDHLCSLDLTIASLADEFHFSVSYASKIFKSLNEIGFLNYVHTRRIELAKGLLVNTDENLNAIALQLGYNNDIALIRQFKKCTGITPGKYRELRQNHFDREEHASPTA